MRRARGQWRVAGSRRGEWLSDADENGLLARMRFSGNWRDYQARALEALDTHLADQRVHVVAAPGSGKTVLGLEFVRRLGRPALILAPTRTVRDQWASRLQPLFLSRPPAEGEISFSLDTPASMTAATYQALHALWADPDGERLDGLCARLRAGGAVTLVLDEAHHLRREWWNALQALIDALPDARLVALTATPPYDAPFAEWSRYEAMCGPIDLEIGVPELVRNGDLCPHQDHVIFSTPDADGLELLERRRKGIATLEAGLRSDAALLDAIEAHRWLTDPFGQAGQILDAPEILSAMLVHLAASGRRPPTPPLELLGIQEAEVPIPNAFWLETLLDALLYRLPGMLPDGEVRIRALRAFLHEHGLIEGGAVRLGANRTTFALMAGNLAKLDSIVAIAAREAEILGADLRMVVLSDHVRAGELPRTARPDYVPAKLGVVPIFEALRRAGIAGQKLAVLTGTLVIVPADAVEALTAFAEARGIVAGELQLAAIRGGGDHLRLTATGEGARRIVELVTALFCAGHLTMLVGTQALLGEGWDAPAINSLVLASNSAAFMSSNQMRGRAIRIDPARPDKVANIWHLATVEPVPGGAIETWGARFDWGHLGGDEAITSDMDLLRRRFSAFEGIANTASPQIESGLARLDLNVAEPARSNAVTFGRARDREAIAARWARSLGNAAARAEVRETVSPSYAPRALAWHDTLGWLAASALSSGVFAAAYELRNVADLAGAGAVGMGVAGIAALATFPKLAKAGWLLFRNGSLESSLVQVAEVVIAAMGTAELVSEAERQSAVSWWSGSASGRVDLVIDGLSRAGERAVIEAVAEILGPVQNPRYLLERRSTFGLVARSDYHAVPAVLAQRKQWAEAFHREWRRRIGSSRLVFTRTPEGRIALLRARARSFAAGFQRRVDRRSRWL